MPVAVVTDTAASLPADLVERHRIAVVPMHLVLDDEDHLDGELPLSDVLATDPRKLGTSAPSPGEWLEVIESADHGEGVFVATIAGHMSAGYKAAWLASTMTDRQVRVFDTGTAAGAQGLVVLAAAAAAASGAPLEEVERAAQQVADKVQLTAALGGLDHLVRSGRVPWIAGLAGNWLGLVPLFSFAGGKVRSLRPATSRAAALERILARWRRSNPGGDARLHVAGLHAGANGDAEQLIAAVRKEVTPVACFTGEFSPVMIAHTGPGLTGLAWWWELAGES
jgi:DegV family protein with EDD domain